MGVAGGGGGGGVRPSDAVARAFAPGQTVWITVTSVDPAAGRVAGELVTPYPPGIPALLPGEVVTPAILHALAAGVEGDGEVVGPEDGSLATLRVVVE